MKALVYIQPNELQLQELPRPELTDGEVVLKIDAVGVCGYDLHGCEHDPRRKPGLVLGHEFVGTVVESAAFGVKTGTRFTGNPLVTCGVCDYCVQGRSNLCPNRTMLGRTRPGAYAEYMSIPASSLIAMPQDMTDVAAALTEPAATAWHAINQSLRFLSRPIHECHVLVIGGGAIGMLAGLILKNLGLIALTVSEPNSVLRKAIHSSIDCKTHDPTKDVLENNVYDYVIVASVTELTRHHSFVAVKPGGVIMHVGLQNWTGELDIRKMILQEVTLLGSCSYTTADLQAAVAALHKGVFGDLAWVEQRPLAKGPQAFRDLHEGHAKTAKTVLWP